MADPIDPGPADLLVVCAEVRAGYAEVDGVRRPILRVTGSAGEVIELLMTPTMAYLLAPQLAGPAVGLDDIADHLAAEHGYTPVQLLGRSGDKLLDEHARLHPGAVT